MEKETEAKPWSREFIEKLVREYCRVEDVEFKSIDFEKKEFHYYDGGLKRTMCNFFENVYEWYSKLFVLDDELYFIEGWFCQKNYLSQGKYTILRSTDKAIQIDDESEQWIPKSLLKKIDIEYVDSTVKNMGLDDIEKYIDGKKSLFVDEWNQIYDRLYEIEGNDKKRTELKRKMRKIEKQNRM